MVLPIKPLPKTVIELGEDKVEITSLSRADALKVASWDKSDVDGAEVFILAKGTGVSEDEAKQWRDTTDPLTAGEVIDGIIYLSGIASKDDADPK